MFNVLLVDDEHLSIVVLQSMLPWKAYGFTEIYTATSVEEALRLLREQRIDACFLDINMPKLSGLDLLKTAKEESMDTKFVVVSGHSDFSYAQQSISFGVIDYCLKPVVADRYVLTMERLVRKVFESRCGHDLPLFLKILSDRATCEQFVGSITAKKPKCHELYIMLLRADQILEKLRQLPDAECDRVCFLKNNEALLVWAEEDKARRARDFLTEHGLHAYMVCGTCECTPETIQKLCKKMFRVFSNQGGVYGEVVFLSNTNEQIDKLIQKVVTYIGENYDKNISLQDISREFNLNYSYLSRVLNMHLGISFAEYLTNVRLKRACQMLTDTYMQITEISRMVGFSDYHYFSKVFKKHYNLTPSQYRDKARHG